MSWKPIATAPTNRRIVVYAPAAEGLDELVCFCEWHPSSAGFCVDELRQPTQWMDKPLLDNEYCCAVCQGMFRKDRLDEEALLELERLYPGVSVEDCDIVCDDCFQKL